MTSNPLPQREHLLSIWAKDRLGERETVEWAVGAIKEIRGSLGADTASLLGLLDKWANERPDLSEETKKVWRLLRRAADESRDQESWLAIYKIKEKLGASTLRSEDIDRLVDCFRPRLVASELSSWSKKDADSRDDRPLRWVHWDFQTAIQSSYQPHIQLQKTELAKLSANFLAGIISGGSRALKEALDYAKEIDWIGGKRDLPNHLVHRVYVTANELSEEDGANVEDRDPDALNNSFAPLVRMISAALFALADKDPAATRPLVQPWRFESEGLFVRLFALGGWKPAILEAKAVGDFLASITDHAFWRWMVYPEVATLRALRWNDLESSRRNALEEKLLAGPTDAAFLSDEQIPDETKSFHRDHELARLVDNGCTVSQQGKDLVSQRRTSDQSFPSEVPVVERGLEAPRARWVPQGDPDIFASVAVDELLENLHVINGQFNLERGNDAEAFGRTLDGKRRILEALALGKAGKEHVDTAWDLLLSYPNEKTQDEEIGRKTTEAVASLALALPPNDFRRLSARLCYWLDSSEEIFPKFQGSTELWIALLPLAEAEANNPATDGDSEDKNEVDLTSAALNEPLGHLLSMFLRRCPAMPKEERDRPPLPPEFVGPLQQLTGRAKELLANRLVVLAHYFQLADLAWLEVAVISVMTEEGIASDRLWEAFAKYAKIPRKDVWARLQDFVFHRLRSADLSPEARRRLAEMSVIVWVWSKDTASEYGFDTRGFRSALSLSNDDARSATAWQFAHLFHPKAPDEDHEQPAELWPRLGAEFFREVWPLEPTLQSPSTANGFARIPGGVGPSFFSEAVNVVLPYLLPFEVWAVMTEFQLDPDKESTEAIVKSAPEDVLVLLAVCISEQQGHGVHDLKRILDWISEVRPDLERDYRMRLLRKLAA